MSEMLPCPFCGRTDLLGMEPRPESGFLGVRCRACGAIGPTGRPIDGEPRARDEAVAHWNRRARFADEKAQPFFWLEPHHAARYRRFIELRAALLADDVCLACGDRTPGRTCQCENDE